MTEVTDKADRAITRANAVFERLDERDGTVRAAARRERQRLNADLKRRAARVGIGLLLISMLTIVVGIIMPIGMFGFLAAVTLAIGAAIALAFAPTQTAASKPPPADLPNGPMVQRFDSYLYRSRAALPPPARNELDALSAILPSLKQTLERVDPLLPEAQDARRLMSLHLPGLIDRYTHVPPAYRGERDGEGISVDERLVEGLAAGRNALAEISERLARQDVAALETQGRFIKSRYGQDDLPAVAPPEER